MARLLAKVHVKKFKWLLQLSYSNDFKSFQVGESTFDRCIIGSSRQGWRRNVKRLSALMNWLWGTQESSHKHYWSKNFFSSFFSTLVSKSRTFLYIMVFFHTDNNRFHQSLSTFNWNRTHKHDIRRYIDPLEQCFSTGGPRPTHGPRRSLW